MIAEGKVILDDEDFCEIWIGDPDIDGVLICNEMRSKFVGKKVMISEVKNDR